MFKHCPNCESKNVIIYEGGQDESICLDCAFTWRQSENYITVSRKVLEQLAGLRTAQNPEESKSEESPEETG